MHEVFLLNISQSIKQIQEQTTLMKEMIDLHRGITVNQKT